MSAILNFDLAGMLEVDVSWQIILMQGKEFFLFNIYNRHLKINQAQKGEISIAYNSFFIF